jgi:hypothetical protein
MEGINQMSMTMAPAKRKNLMGNIKSRVDSGSYDIGQHFKKNKKNLEEKVKFFQKKEVAGELKPYMIPRYDAAKDLLDRLVALKPGEVANVPMAMAQPVPAPAPITVPATSPGFRSNITPETMVAEPVGLNTVVTKVPNKKTFTLKKRTKKATIALPTVPYAPEFNPPAASARPRGTVYGEYSPGGTFNIRGVNPVVTGSPRNAFNNVTRLRIRVPGTRKSKKVKVKAPTPAVVVEESPFNPYNKYYESATRLFRVPELYDPFTGRKFSPDEDPLAEIERAHNLLGGLYNPFNGNKFTPHENPQAKINRAYTMLQDLLKRVHRKAATIRRRANKDKNISRTKK